MDRPVLHGEFYREQDWIEAVVAEKLGELLADVSGALGADEPYPCLSPIQMKNLSLLLFQEEHIQILKPQ